MSQIPYTGRSALLLLTLLLPALAHAQAPPLTLTSPNPESFGFFGYEVSSVPDADGDGRSDLLIGAYTENGGVADAGRAYLFSGATGSLLHTLTSPNPEFEGYFGGEVAGVPDVNGDGRGDLLVSAVFEDGGASQAGRAYLFSGATGALLRTLTSPNPEFNGVFGGSVSGISDVNSDGRGDLLIGASGEDGGAAYAGRAYLFSGATGALLRTLTSPNPEADGSFGGSVSGVSDVNNDGRDDLLVGAWFEDGGVGDAGRAYLFSGSNGVLLRTLASPNPEGNGRFGLHVTGVPDADGDGRGDLLIGAFQEDGGAMDAGRAYLFRSGTSSGITLSASGSPTTISPGGTVTVTATVSNATNQPAALDLWVVVERNGSPVLTRLIGSGTLPARATVTRAFGVRVPSTAPAGVYTVAVNAGDFPSVVAASSFEVTVAGAPRGRTPAVEPFAVPPPSGDVFADDALASAAASSSVAVSPNPFADQATLRFTLAEASPVRLSVYDVLGREVAALVEGALTAGTHTATFAADGLPSGVYVWQLEASGALQTGRLTLLD